MGFVRQELDILLRSRGICCRPRRQVGRDLLEDVTPERLSIVYVTITAPLLDSVYEFWFCGAFSGHLY